MTAESLATPAPHLKNRRAWLITFGIVEILIAVFCYLTVLLVGLVFILPQFRHANSSQPDTAHDAGVVISSMLVYGSAGALFFIFGVGSVRCRNWARMGMIALSGIWLVIGVTTVLVIGLLMPGVLRQQAEPGSPSAGVVFAVLLVFMIFFAVVAPAGLLFFYTRPSVRATCVGRQAMAAPAGSTGSRV